MNNKTKKQIEKGAKLFAETFENDELFSENVSIAELRDKRKQSFIAYLQDPVNKEMRLWQALRNWALVEYQDDFVTKNDGELPVFYNIYAGFDRDASIDTFHLE